MNPVEWIVPIAAALALVAGLAWLATWLLAHRD